MNSENRPVLDELEPRILLSGSPAPDAGEIPAIQVEVSSEAGQRLDCVNEILFIDSAVENYSQLIQDFERNVVVYAIPDGEDGLSFISEALISRQDISAIHIFSHGAEGEVTLGGVALNEKNLSGYAEVLQQWGNSLTADADILLYGCKTGESPEFISKISVLTGADVAASDDLTGAQKQGGDAELEVEYGIVGTNELFNQGQLDAADILLAEPEFSPKTVWSWDPGSSSQPNSTSGALPGVLDAGGDTNLAWQFDGTDSFSAESFDAYNSADASFEFYLNADALSDDGDYLIFETGGSVHGTTLWIERSGGVNTLKLLVQYNTVNEYFLEADLSSLSGYFNAAFTIDRDPANGEVILYLNGSELDTVSNVALSDWAGSDNTSVGGRESGNSAENNIFGSFSNFVGEIARINFYNSTLSAGEISTANSNITDHNSAILAPVDSGEINPFGDTVENIFGHLFSDADPDIFVGIAVSGDNTVAEGSWQYDAGLGWTDITGVSTANALFLDGTSKLRFVSSGASTGFPGTLEVHAVDSSAGVTFSSGAGAETGNIVGNDGIDSDVTELETYVLKANESPVFGGDFSDALYTWDADNASQPFSTSTTASTISSGNDRLGNAWNFTGQGMTATSFTDRNTDMSLEFWFKVDAGLADRNYYLFETGGDSRGHSMWLEVDSGVFTLHLHTQPISDTDNATKVDLTHNITSLVTGGEFIQAAYSIEKTNSNGTAKLYVNGTERDSHTGNLNEWSGGDNTGIGISNGSAAIDDEGYTLSNLIGQVALINYFNSVVSQDTFVQSYSYYSGTDSVLSSIDYGLSGNAKILAGSVPLSDVDSPNFDGGSLTVQVTTGADASDTLATDYDYSSFASISGSGTNITFNFNSQATVAKVQALVQSIKFNANDNLIDRVVTFTVNDGDGSAPASFTAEINIMGANNAPELTLGDYSLVGITEDELDSSGTAINSILGLDAAITDIDAGDRGIVITSLSGFGTWQYKLASDSWQDISINDGEGLHLRLTDSVRYVPNGLNGETAFFDFRAWDLTSDAQAGEVDSLGIIHANSAYSSTEDSVTIDIATINDAPDFVQNPTFSWDADLDQASQPLNTGTLPSTVDTNFGELGKAWIFTGANGITADGFSNSHRNGDASFGMWLKPGALAQGNYCLFESGGDGRGTTLWYEVDNSGNHYLNLHIQPVNDTDNASKVDLKYDVTSLTSDYFHVAFTIEIDNTDGVAELFVNGFLVDSQRGVLPGWNGGNQTGIARFNSSVSTTGDYTGLSNFVGEIAELNFYNSALNASDVNAIYNAAQGILPVSLQATGLNATNPPGETVDNLFGNFFGDADSDSLSGVAVTGDASGANGDWQYSTDNGMNWHNIGTVSTNNALVLSASSLLRFLPATGFSGYAGDLNLHAVDDTQPAFTVGLTLVRVDASSPGDDSPISDTALSLMTEVNATNTAPVAHDDQIQVEADSVYMGNLFDDNGNGVDADLIDGDAIQTVTVNGDALLVGIETMLISGALLTVNIDGSFTYNPNGVFDNLSSGVNGSDNFIYEIEDVYGNLASANVNLVISGVNVAPEISSPSTVTLDEDQIAQINGLVLSDADAGTTAITLSLSVSNGTLSLGSLSALSGNNNSSSITVSGTLAALNEALSGLSYTPDADYNDSDSLQVTVNDNDPENPLGDSSSISLFILPVNDVPILNLPADLSVDEDAAIKVSGISVEDIDGGDIRIDLSVGNGQLILGNLTSITVVSGANFSDSISLQGTVIELNGALNDLFYQGRLHFNGQETLAVTVDDLGNGGGAVLSDTGQLGITVNPVNDAPLITAPDSLSVNEDEVFQIFGVCLADLDLTGNEMLELKLQLNVSKGTLSVSDLSGATLTQGQQNSSFIELQGTLNALNAALMNLNYVGNADYNGDDALSINVYDQGNIGSGGALSDSATVDLTIDAVADTPDLTVLDIGGKEGEAIDFPIVAAAGEDNEVLSVIISGFPLQAVFSAGVQEGTDWILNSSDLRDLTVIVPSDATFLVQVLALSIDGSSIVTVSQSITVTVDPIFVTPVQTPPATPDAVDSTGVNMDPVVDKSAFSGNSLTFLQGGTNLQFNQSFLSDDALGVIAELFNFNTNVDTEVADVVIQEQAVKDHSVYDLSALTDEEQSFILDLIQNIETDEENLSEESEEEEEELLYSVEDAALNEFSMKNNMEYTITQDYLDARTSLDDTLQGEFDCFSA